MYLAISVLIFNSGHVILMLFSLKRYVDTDTYLKRSFAARDESRTNYSFNLHDLKPLRRTEIIRMFMLLQIRFTIGFNHLLLLVQSDGFDGSSLNVPRD